MKRIVLSTVAVATLTTMVHASTQTELAELKQQMAAMMKKIERLEAEQAKKTKQTKVATKTQKKQTKQTKVATKTQKKQEKQEHVVEKKKEKEYITIVREDSPEFLLGKETDINMKFQAQDDPNMWFKAGIRLQGTFENKETKDLATGETSTLQDAYLRRVRLEVAAGFDEHTSFVMDIRNDKANIEDKGEGGFSVGDAYVQIKKPFDTSLVNFKLYRAKIDVSRDETVKSSRVIVYDRPKVADEAAQFISENRRAANAQMYGDWKKKVHYQLAFGDATASDHTIDASGTKLTSSPIDGSIEDQNFFYGGKIILSPFDGWEETERTETYFGVGKHFEVGVGYWKVGDINYDTSFGPIETDHTLINYELSAHYKNAFVQAEYFDFDGVVKSWVTGETGTSSGWYVTGEYVMPDFGYLAPFFRYENWDTWNDAPGYDYTAKIAGVNWYLRGNTTKVGLLVEKDTYDENIGDEDTTSVRVTSQWFF